jgi:hypothetical protein
MILLEIDYIILIILISGKKKQTGMDGQEESGYTNDRNTSDDDLFRDLDPML